MPIQRNSEASALGHPFVDALMDADHDQIAAGKVAVVIAHPDDETVGCGGLIGRLDGVSVVLVTDGAPRNLTDARALGFETAEAYSAKRLAETKEALKISGVAADRLITLGIPDQEAAHDLASLARRLAAIIEERDIELVITHAYEGGHPDHDATAFAVHQAARLLAGRRPLLLLEMPYYRLGDGAALHQSFGPSGNVQIAVPLHATEVSRKRRMIEAHGTQKERLAHVETSLERFRPVPTYDFTVLPNDGRLLYEGKDWGMNGKRWQELVKAALDELGPEGSAG